MTFQEWMKEVDRILTRYTGLGHDDLADYNYRETYQWGGHPAEAACGALDNNDAPQYVINQVAEKYGIGWY